MRPTSQEERKMRQEEMKQEHIRKEKLYFLKKVEDGRIVTWNPYLEKRKSEFVLISKEEAYKEIAKEKQQRRDLMDSYTAEDDVEIEEPMPKEEAPASGFVNEVSDSEPEKPADPVVEGEIEDKDALPLNKLNRRELIKFIKSKDSAGSFTKLSSSTRNKLLEIAKGL